MFNDDSDEPDPEQATTRRERGQALAEVVRQTIAPGLWRVHGGTHSVIRYHRGLLVVLAPAYVHARIGRPVGQP